MLLLQEGDFHRCSGKKNIVLIFAKQENLKQFFTRPINLSAAEIHFFKPFKVIAENEDPLLPSILCLDLKFSYHE